MTPGAQLDLFAPGPDAALGFDATFARAMRTPLDDRSWIEVVPGWLSDPAALFDRLRHGVAWAEHHRRMFDQVFLEPRLTAEYRCLADVPHAGLVEAAALLSAHYGVGYDSLWLNLYRDGRDSTGWHRDRFSCRKAECIVPVLTLGAPRRFQLRPRNGGRAVSITPRSGDLVVMGGRCQQEWVHVPKAPGPTGARISVNFQSAFQALRD